LGSLGRGIDARSPSRSTPKVGCAILKDLSDDYLLNDKLRAADATDL
jgi:hypothetical protein